MDKMHRELQNDSNIDENMKMKHEIARKENEINQLNELLKYKDIEIQHLKSKVDDQRTLSRICSSDYIHEVSTVNNTPDTLFEKAVLLEHKQDEGSRYETRTDSGPKLRKEVANPIVFEEIIETEAK